MCRKIIIIGGLTEHASRHDVLHRLTRDVSDADEWDWIQAEQRYSFQPPQSLVNRLLDELRKWQRAKKAAVKGGLPPTPDTMIVVKLGKLHGRTAHQLYSAWDDPVLAPREVDTIEELIRWLRSPESNLFPPTEWWAGTLEAALIAILSKLIRKKSWNASVHGHAWTLEEFLLNEAPVMRPDRQPVAVEARKILPTLGSHLLLTKGSGQGQTPKEWSINTKFLQSVKQAILARSVTPLAQHDCLSSLISRIRSETEKPFRLDGEIVSGRVDEICRRQH